MAEMQEIEGAVGRTTFLPAGEAAATIRGQLVERPDLVAWVCATAGSADGLALRL